jgi:hypothetical protein
LQNRLDGRYNQFMSVQNLEINKANLLNVVVSLPKNEFEQFVSDARKLKRREESLLAKIPKFDLSEEEKAVYKVLLRKFRAQDISEAEHKQMMKLTDKLEGLNVERLECLMKIAEIRRKTLREVMKELNIKPKSYE